MATDRDVIKALTDAAEALHGRALTQDEVSELIQYFKSASGSYHEKALEALEKEARMTRHELLKEASASTNTDRRMQDLKRTLENWKKDQK